MMGGKLRFGLVTPIVTLNPRAHCAWEESAGIDELRGLAVAADEMGFDFLTASEHVAVPRSVAPIRGSRYYDPLATLAYLAAVTERIHLVPHVVVLPYSHPLALAKRYGTLDAISDGRLILGVGVGSLEEEFRLLGVDFADRGPRYVEALQALRAALSGSEPSFHGEHFQFDDFIVDPSAVQERVPIWLGGRSARSLRRACQWGDGWIPFGLGAEALSALLADAHGAPWWHEREARGEAPLEVVIQPARPLALDEPGAAEDVLALLAKFRDAGVTGFKLRFRAQSLGHFIEQLEVFQSEVASRMRNER